MRKQTKLLLGVAAAIAWVWYTKKKGLTLLGQPAAAATTPTAAAAAQAAQLSAMGAQVASALPASSVSLT